MTRLVGGEVGEDRVGVLMARLPENGPETARWRATAKVYRVKLMLDSVSCRDDCVPARSRPLSCRKRPHFCDGANHGDRAPPPGRGRSIVARARGRILMAEMIISKTKTKEAVKECNVIG